MEPLTREFFDRDTLTVAQELLGKCILRRWEEQTVAARIVETEAYIGPIDKACHAYAYKRTPRTETLFARPGTAYLYLIYGRYHCLNFVTEAEGIPCAVLIRAVEPVSPVDARFLSRQRFGVEPEAQTTYQRKHFLNGPGKVCQALVLDKSLDGIDITAEPLWVEDDGFRPQHIHTSPRIGIDYAEEAKEFPWRFFL